MNEERLEALMVKVVDGVATPAEREELMAYLAHEPALRRELDAHLALKSVTDGWVKRLELDLAEDAHRKSLGFRLESAIGVSLFVVGLGLLTGWGFVELTLDETVPVAIRVGAGAMLAGSVVLLVAVIRWRLKMLPKDHYTEVIR